jgi:hypothetical protein
LDYINLQITGDETINSSVEILKNKSDFPDCKSQEMSIPPTGMATTEK